MDAMVVHFRPRGSGLYTELCRRLYGCSLAACESVADYTRKFWKFPNEMLALRFSLGQSKSYQAQLFLNRLRLAYYISKTTFNQTHNMLPIAVTALSAAMAAVTFDLTT